MSYAVKPTSKFKKELKLLQKRGYNLGMLSETIATLASGETLSPEYNDHPLKGRWIGNRECHILPDWLLIYRIDNDVLVLTLVRSGTHADLFGL